MCDNRDKDLDKERDLEKESFQAKKKLDVYMGITPEIQQRLLDAVDWNLKMVERGILKANAFISPKRGDIWLVDLGINIGTEMDKERPCIVVSYDEYNDKSGLATVIPITRAKYSHMTQFVITDDCLSFVYDKLEGTVKAEQITTKSKVRFKAKIGELNEKGLHSLNMALINHLCLVDCCNDNIKSDLENQKKKFEEEFGYEFNDSNNNNFEPIKLDIENDDCMIEISEIIPEGIEIQD